MEILFLYILQKIEEFGQRISSFALENEIISNISGDELQPP